MTATTSRLTTAALLQQFAADWQAATRHAFIDAVRRASLPRAAFDLWLAQDYGFVDDLLVFQARLLARAPRPAQAVLAGGLVALEAELTWFERHARARGLRLDGPRHAVTIAYCDLLEDLDGAAYPTAITGLWAIERAYLEAWRGALPASPAYAEFVEHWTVPEFAEYVAGLERAAESALAAAEVQVQASAARAFARVARLEAAFWQMALDAA